mmetsp:Transcript_30098/g.56241  ORF Transcript_30098/g.56241 Transcript_30098/m.56241 type:complete len:271 (-) Transcript_30098:385-1197(-)
MEHANSFNGAAALLSTPCPIAWSILSSVHARFTAVSIAVTLVTKLSTGTTSSRITGYDASSSRLLRSDSHSFVLSSVNPNNFAIPSAKAGDSCCPRAHDTWVSPSAKACSPNCRPRRLVASSCVSCGFRSAVLRTRACASRRNRFARKASMAPAPATTRGTRNVRLSWDSALRHAHAISSPLSSSCAGTITVAAAASPAAFPSGYTTTYHRSPILFSAYPTSLPKLVNRLLSRKGVSEGFALAALATALRWRTERRGMATAPCWSSPETR